MHLMSTLTSLSTSTIYIINKSIKSITVHVRNQQKKVKKYILKDIFTSNNYKKYYQLVDILISTQVFKLRLEGKWMMTFNNKKQSQ